jgi:uncharacterized protein (TIGR04141 family)
LEEHETIFKEVISKSSGDLSKVYITGYDDGENEIFVRLKFLDIVEGELDYKRKKYFRIRKKWYEVGQEYLDAVEKDFSKIVALNKIGYLSDWDKKFKDENDYINANVTPTKILAHCRKINYIEVADLIDTKEKILIHIKRGQGSYLRNLFSQGLVSGQLLSRFEDFRSEACSKLKFTYHEGEMTVLFVIISEKTNIDSIFTLYAKVDFIERYQYLLMMGFQVRYLVIKE